MQSLHKLIKFQLLDAINDGRAEKIEIYGARNFCIFLPLPTSLNDIFKMPLFELYLLSAGAAAAPEQKVT